MKISQKKIKIVSEENAYYGTRYDKERMKLLKTIGNKTMKYVKA